MAEPLLKQAESPDFDLDAELHDILARLRENRLERRSNQLMQRLVAGTATGVVVGLSAGAAFLQLDGRDGTVLKRADYPPPEAMGGPSVFALRPALHGALLDAIGADTLTLGTAAVGCAVAGDRPTLHLANGAVFGALYSAIAPRVPLPSWARGPAAGLAEQAAEQRLAQSQVVHSQLAQAQAARGRQ